MAGAGGHLRIHEAKKQLDRYFAQGDRTVDIIGFSRGAALALHFANQVQKEQPGAEVRFLGLWDTVASFGLPGNDLNIGWDLTLPDHVKHCYHAMALDERRRNFTPTRVVPRKGGVLGDRLQEVWFRGVHSDVGGGQSLGLSNITLCWMLRRAKEAGLPVNEAKLRAHEALCDPDASISKNLDPKKDSHRTIHPGDCVHELVRPRGSQGGNTHNDPPPGVRIVHG